VSLSWVLSFGASYWIWDFVDTCVAGYRHRKWEEVSLLFVSILMVGVLYSVWAYLPSTSPIIRTDSRLDQRQLAVPHRVEGGCDKDIVATVMVKMPPPLYKPNGKRDGERV
jgi:hypothetical protein